MSHPRYRLLDTVITSGSDVDRAVRGIKSFEGAPPGVGRDAPRTKVVAEGEGPAGEAPLPRPAGEAPLPRFSRSLPVTATQSQPDRDGMSLRPGR